MSTAAWTPASLPGLVLWLQADRGVTQAGTVTAWADQSGNANNYAFSTAAPAYSATGWQGTKPGVTFTGAELLVGGTAVYGTTAVTIGARFASTQSSSEVTLFGMQYNAFHYSLNQFSGKYKFLGPTGGASNTLTAATQNDGTPKSLIATWDASLAAGSLDLYVNNVIEATLGTDVGATSANNDRNAIGGIARVAAADIPQWAGSLGVIVVTSAKLSATDRGLLNAFLNGY